jgi:hypothetical protein
MHKNQIKKRTPDDAAPAAAEIDTNHLYQLFITT